jgi:hypothetical protein
MEGTDADELAMLFASELSGKAYRDEVVFPTPSVGQYLIQVDGDGLDYAVLSVPEPASLLLLTLGSAAILFSYTVKVRPTV